MSVAENLKTIRKRVDAACERAGRRPEEVTLIAVSKTKPLSMLQEAYGAGARDFGAKRPKVCIEPLRYRRSWKSIRRCRRMPDSI